MNALLKANQKIEKKVVSAYKSIENQVVGSYKKIENQFVEAFLTPEDTVVPNELLANSCAAEINGSEQHE